MIRAVVQNRVEAKWEEPREREVAKVKMTLTKELEGRLDRMPGEDKKPTLDFSHSFYKMLVSRAIHSFNSHQISEQKTGFLQANEYLIKMLLIVITKQSLQR